MPSVKVPLRYLAEEFHTEPLNGEEEGTCLLDYECFLCKEYTGKRVLVRANTFHSHLMKRKDSDTKWQSRPEGLKWQRHYMSNYKQDRPKK